MTGADRGTSICAAATFPSEASALAAAARIPCYSPDHYAGRPHPRVRRVLSDPPRLIKTGVAQQPERLGSRRTSARS